MSASPPKADIAEHRRDVRFVPTSWREQVRQGTSLFNYFVSNGEYACRNCKAEFVSGPEIDGQFKFGGCLHRQVSQLVTLENVPSIDACLMIRFGKTAAVADQTAG
jgi:hypothetical protein